MKKFDWHKPAPAIYSEKQHANENITCVSQCTVQKRVQLK